MGQYDKIRELTFDDQDNLYCEIDNSAYTEIEVTDFEQFWRLLKVVNGKVIIVTT